MFDPHIISRNFGKAARDYDAHAQLQQVVRQECITMAENFWKPGSKLLDLGCGTGAFTNEIRQRELNWQITQLDAAEGMCKVAYEQNPFVAAGSSDAIPFADSSFDGVFSSLMLQWVYDPLPVMREISRVINFQGICVVSTLVQGTLHELRDSFTAIDDALHVNHFADPAPLTALCVHGGFKLLACEQETITIHYPDVLTLMRSLKAIGASATQEKRKGGLMTPRQLEKLDQAYRERFVKKGKKKTLPTTWQVLYMGLEKST